MRLDALAGVFPHLDAEHQKDHHYKTAQSRCHIGDKEYRVVYSVYDNRRDECKCFVSVFQFGTEPCQRIVIAHQDAETEVSWHSKYRTADTHRQIDFRVGEEIHHILQRRKTE